MYVYVYICIQVPLQDVSLAPEVVVVLDHHTHIFIWSGSKVYAASACTHTNTPHQPTTSILPYNTLLLPALNPSAATRL